MVESLDEFWDDLLQFVEERRVIPIVGPDLLVARVDGKSMPLHAAIARRLAEKLRVRAEPGRLLHGRVTAIEPIDEETVAGRSYRVWVGLSDSPAEPRAGLTGRAWIVAPRRTPASHLVHWLARFLRTDLWV